MKPAIKFNKELGWNICKYAFMDCGEAKDPKYFDPYCINNGQDCSMKKYEYLFYLQLNEQLRISSDLNKQFKIDSDLH